MKSFFASRNGSIAVTSAVAMVVLFAATGAAVTYSMTLTERNAHQQALDAAVLAAASAPQSMSNDERIAIAERAFSANLADRAFSKGTSATITTETAGPAFLVADQTVRGTAQAQVANYFSGFIGSDRLPVTVKSAARIVAQDPVCVLALDASSPQGIEIYGSAQFTARNCSAQANSSNGSGMRQYGSAVGRARQFGVKGGYSGDGFHPRPITGVPVIADPYAAVPVPPTGACVDIASKLQHTPAILTPGTYCGGIRIMANSVIILEPGVYVMKDGPFRVDSNSTVRGSEVVIAFMGTDSTLYLGSGADVELTSPTSGTYMNIQFLQDKASNVGGWATLLGDIKLVFDGVMYFPTQHIWIGGGSIIEAKSPSYIFVADKLWFQDSSVIEVWQENSRNLAISDPPRTIGVSAQLID